MKKGTRKDPLLKNAVFLYLCFLDVAICHIANGLYIKFVLVSDRFRPFSGGLPGFAGPLWNWIIMNPRSQL